VSEAFRDSARFGSTLQIAERADGVGAFANFQVGGTALEA
jgi:hypothetical protein